MTNDYDPFINNRIYPDAANIFSIQLKSINEVKDSCIFVIDTNALLLPFLTGSQSLDEIRKVLNKLKVNKQLIIPGQVAREFANNRPDKLKDIYQQLYKKQTGIQSVETGNYPLLQGNEDYKKLIDLEKSINEKIKEYRKYISSVLDDVRNWQWNDPVSLMYREIFSDDTILDLKLDEQKIKEDLTHRYLHKIPPGYKDGAKEDDGIGDLLIWLTILEIAKQEKDVVFVSSDEKTDWFHRSEKYPLYPRFELISEFSRISNGKSFHMLKLSGFLDLFGASKKAVTEVALEEVIVNSVSASKPSLGYEFIKAVYYWLIGRYTNVKQLSEFPDFIVSDKSESIITAVEVIGMVAPVSERALLDGLRHRVGKAIALINDEKCDKFHFVFITRDDKYPFIQIKNVIEKVKTDYWDYMDRIDFTYGFLNGMIFSELVVY